MSAPSRLDRLATRCARALLRLQPAAFRRAHGEEVELLLCELVRDAHAAAGLLAGVRCLAAQCADLLATAARLRVASLRASWRGAAGRALAPAAASLALALLLLARGVLPEPGAELYDELVVNAVDPAGSFTLTLRRGRLVAGTVDEVPVPAHRLVQQGNRLRILAADGSVVLAADFEPPGMIRWESRP